MKTEYKISCVETGLAGRIWAAVGEDGLVLVEFGGSSEEVSEKLHAILARQAEKMPAVISYQPDDPGVQQALQQIAEYLDGRRRDFDLPVDWNSMQGFQRKALQATFAIPYGKTATYAEIARQAGKPGAARAAGRAEATNPMPLVIPCHRVVGSDGRLHGYGGPGGITLKAKLIHMERANSPD